MIKCETCQDKKYITNEYVNGRFSFAECDKCCAPLKPIRGIEELPTVFRGCWWDAQWEFDAPAIVYYPFKKYGFGSALEIDQLVENICIDICLGETPRTEFHEDVLREFKWRHWNPKGFAKRKNAIHRQITVKWFYQIDGELMFDFIKEEQSEGPF